MIWFTVLEGLLKLVTTVSSIMERKQLLDAGAAKEVAKYNENVIKKIRKARDVRNAVRNASDSLRDDDGFKRDK